MDGKTRMIGGSVIGTAGPGRGFIANSLVIRDANINHPDDCVKVVTAFNPGSNPHAISRLVHNPEAAAIALRLCKEYAEANKQ